MNRFYRAIVKFSLASIIGLLPYSFVHASIQNTNFSGFYIGHNFGYSEMDVNERLNFDFGDDDTEADTKVFDYDKNLDSTMFTTGIHGGYGHQFNKFYLGPNFSYSEIDVNERSNFDLDGDKKPDELNI